MLKRFFFLIAGLSVLFFGFTFVAFAISEQDITFPVAELGNCANKRECKAYCNAPEHIQACVAFGKAHNLLTKQEAERGEKFAKIATEAGPGGCKGQDECHAYCENILHIEECVAFGEKHGLLSGGELDEARKVAQALKRGVKPPAGCTSKQSCEAYCSEEGHFDECIAFGREAGFISDDEYKIVKETHGKGPGDCRGKDQCEAYCQDESHIKECVEFGRKHGFISEKEADIAIKTGGKGPGGCHRDECRAYCENPDHQDECMSFAKEHGLISEEQIKQMEEGKSKFQEALNQAPSEVQTCIRETVGPDLKERIQSGAMQPGPEIGERIRECFEKQRSHAGEGMRKGPGGCENQDECKAYCSDESHASECGQFFQGDMQDRPPFDVRPSGEGGSIEDSRPNARPSVERGNTEASRPNVRPNYPGNGNQYEGDAAAGGNGQRESQPRVWPGPHDPNSDPRKDERACVQVITPAREARTGACRQFPTPCAVPPGWEKVEACNEHSDEDVAPPMRKGGQYPSRFRGPGGCSTQAECAAYCQGHPEECGMIPGQDQGARPVPLQVPPPSPDSSLAPLQSLGALALQAFLFLVGK